MPKPRGLSNWLWKTARDPCAFSDDCLSERAEEARRVSARREFITPDAMAEKGGGIGRMPAGHISC